MNRGILFLILNSVFLILNFSCATPGNIQNENLSYLYRKDKQHFSVKFNVWHFSNDSSQLFIRVDPKEFIYKRSGDFFTAEVFVRYRLLESYVNPLLIDSAIKKFIFQKKENALLLMVYLEFGTMMQIEMLMEC